MPGLHAQHTKLAVAESGTFCVKTSGQTEMQFYNEQELVVKWGEAEHDSDRQVGSRNGQDQFSGGEPKLNHIESHR